MNLLLALPGIAFVVLSTVFVARLLGSVAVML